MLNHISLLILFFFLHNFNVIIKIVKQIYYKTKRDSSVEYKRMN